MFGTDNPFFPPLGVKDIASASWPSTEKVTYAHMYARCRRGGRCELRGMGSQNTSSTTIPWVLGFHAQYSRPLVLLLRFISLSSWKLYLQRSCCALVFSVHR
jgi:hypothetical protein